MRKILHSHCLLLAAAAASDAIIIKIWMGKMEMNDKYCIKCHRSENIVTFILVYANGIKQISGARAGGACKL
jgi:hypothetical protein